MWRLRRAIWCTSSQVVPNKFPFAPSLNSLIKKRACAEIVKGMRRERSDSKRQNVPRADTCGKLDKIWWLRIQMTQVWSLQTRALFCAKIRRLSGIRSKLQERKENQKQKLLRTSQILRMMKAPQKLREIFSKISRICRLAGKLLSPFWVLS